MDCSRQRKNIIVTVQYPFWTLHCQHQRSGNHKDKLINGYNPNADWDKPTLMENYTQCDARKTHWELLS